MSIKEIGKVELIDHSTPDKFCFSLYCEECGEEWKSVPIRFSRAGIVPQREGKRIIYETLYQMEKEAALQKAIKQAKTIFSRCPICNRLVCDRCFFICDDLDMCCACANRLEEKGAPVMERSE